ncbi:MAG: aminoacyl-tRNA hydrolase [bacterium]|nr:aminoacyl-tRNA hydrolase [bacterium]
MSYIIVGLGNPGEEYKKTRHNAGRMALEYFCKTEKFPEWEHNKKLNALVSEGKIQKERVMLLLPETFMNKSGGSVKSLVKNKKQASRLVVVHDDLDMPIGSLKISFNRGSAGHRGIESIKRAIKTEAFVRVRIGISPASFSGKLKKPHGESDVNNFILGTFKPKEQELLKRVIKRVADIIKTIVSEGMARAMNEYN